MTLMLRHLCDDAFNLAGIAFGLLLAICFLAVAVMVVVELGKWLRGGPL